MTTRLKSLGNWVAETAELTRPERIRWCTGKREENDEFVRRMLARGDLLELNQDRYPNCYLHRSDPRDVAITEDNDPWWENRMAVSPPLIGREGPTTRQTVLRRIPIRVLPFRRRTTPVIRNWPRRPKACQSVPWSSAGAAAN